MDYRRRTYLFQLRKKGRSTVEADEEININSHWDVRITNGKVQYKVDVKTMKRISRKDEEKQDKYHWVELHGVRKYDNGWLFGGKAELIAFETMNEFIIVERERLIDIVNRNLEYQEVADPNEAIYKVYKRPNRFDSLTLVPTEHLRQCLYNLAKGMII